MNPVRGLAPLILLTFAVALSSTPASAAADLSSPPIYARLVAPAEGAKLLPGSRAVIAWEGVDLPPRAVEWEAFLSVNGGKTYALRITPHLDISIRRFTFRVPSLPTSDARLMLRFGDEKREVGFEAPQRFAIATGARDWAPVPRRALSRGETPRKGERGVVIWVEGSREGGGLREVASNEPLLGLSGVRPGALPLFPLLWPSAEERGLPPPAVTPALFPSTPAASAPARSPRSAPVEVRLLTHRFNE
jgi:hypothetical protein